MPKPGIVSTRADFLGGASAAGLIQWVIRFCQLPETLPVFCAWVRSLWPECPYTDEQIVDELVKVHNLWTASIIASQE